MLCAPSVTTKSLRETARRPAARLQLHYSPTASILKNRAQFNCPIFHGPPCPSGCQTKRKFHSPTPAIPSQRIRSFFPILFLVGKRSKDRKKKKGENAQRENERRTYLILVGEMRSGRSRHKSLVRPAGRFEAMIKVVFYLSSVAVGQAVAFHLFDVFFFCIFFLLVFPSAGRRIRRSSSPRRSASAAAAGRRTRTLRQLVRQRLLDPLLLLDVTVDL